MWGNHMHEWGDTRARKSSRGPDEGAPGPGRWVERGQDVQPDLETLGHERAVHRQSRRHVPRHLQLEQHDRRSADVPDGDVLWTGFIHTRTNVILGLLQHGIFDVTQDPTKEPKKMSY